jgi:hypothetical protein
MGFFGDLLSATVKVVAAPIAVVEDVVMIASGQEADNTKKLVDSAVDDLVSAIEEATGGK